MYKINGQEHQPMLLHPLVGKIVQNILGIDLLEGCVLDASTSPLDSQYKVLKGRTDFDIRGEACRFGKTGHSSIPVILLKGFLPIEALNSLWLDNGE